MLVLLLGAIGELFVPTLPLNIPRRGFGVYSWLVLFQSQVRGFGPIERVNPALLDIQELRFEVAHDLDRSMSLEELEKRFSDKEIKFVV
jgi:hypothetical protein